MKNYLKIILLSALCLAIFSSGVFILSAENVFDTSYTPLAPIPNVATQDQPVKMSIYLEGMIKLLIGAAGVLAVIMIIIGGVQYMTTDVIDSKSAAKDKIVSALKGFLLAIISWLILYTINPSLLNMDVSTPGPSSTNSNSK